MATQALRHALTILLAAVLTRLLSKEQLGTFRQLDLVLGFLMGILGLKIGQTLYYYLPSTRLRQRRPLVVQSLLLSLVCSALMGAVMYASATPVARILHNDSLALLLRIYSLYPLVMTVTDVVPSFLVSLDRALAGGSYTVGASLVRLLSVVVLTLMGYSLITAVWSMVVAGMFFVLLGALIMLRMSPGRGLPLDVPLLRSQVAYAAPLLATTVMAVLNMQYDKALISIFFDPQVYAVYSCGAMELPLVDIVTFSFTAAAMPILVQLYARGEKTQALRVWHEATRKSALVMMPSFVLLLVVAQDLIILLFGPSYARAAPPFAVYLGLLPLRVAIYGAVIRAAGQTRPIAIGAAIGLITNVLISTLLVWLGRGALLSYLGPSIGTIIAQFAASCYMLEVIRRINDVHWADVMPWRQLWALFLASLMAGAGVFVVPMGALPLVVRLAARTALFAALLALIIWKGNLLQPEEKQLLRSLAVRRLRRTELMSTAASDQERQP